MRRPAAAALAALLGLLRPATAITARRGDPRAREEAALVPHHGHGVPQPGVVPRPRGAFGAPHHGVAPPPPRAATTTTANPSPSREALTTTPRHWEAHRIPFQLVVTAGKGTVDDLPPRMRENLDQTLALNPGLRLRFLNDTACADFIAANWPDGLLTAFSGEDFGPYRGDVCRAAVVAVEGGFYADLDVQFRLPLSQLVDGSTAFMTTYDFSCNILNAMFAAEPRSAVMQSVVDSIMDWYALNRTEGKREWMGTKTMYDGLQKVIRRDCPHVNLVTTKRFQFACGHQHPPYGSSIRLYREKRLRCGQDEVGDAAQWVEKECPAARKVPAYSGQRFGIFEPGEERKLVAWSRFEGCEGWHCQNRRMAAGTASAAGDGAGSDAEHPACKV